MNHHITTAVYGLSVLFMGIACHGSNLNYQIYSLAGWLLESNKSQNIVLLCSYVLAGSCRQEHARSGWKFFSERQGVGETSGNDPRGTGSHVQLEGHRDLRCMAGAGTLIVLFFLTSLFAHLCSLLLSFACLSSCIAIFSLLV